MMKSLDTKSTKRKESFEIIKNISQIDLSLSKLLIQSFLFFQDCSAMNYRIMLLVEKNESISLFLLFLLLINRLHD
jgi:hypothetical protein